MWAGSATRVRFSLQTVEIISKLVLMYNTERLFKLPVTHVTSEFNCLKISTFTYICSITTIIPHALVTYTDWHLHAFDLRFELLFSLYPRSGGSWLLTWPGCRTEGAWNAAKTVSFPSNLFPVFVSNAQAVCIPSGKLLVRAQSDSLLCLDQSALGYAHSLWCVLLKWC